MVMKYQELMDSVSKGKLASAYLFSGEEDFLKEQALKKIISSQVKPGFQSFDLDVVYGDEVDFGTIKSRAETLPMGSARRVLLLKNLEGLPQGAKKRLLDYLDSPPPKTIIVLVASKVDLRKGFYRDLAKKTRSVIFWRLSESQVPGWILGYLKEKGLSIEEEALYLLQNSVGNDLFSLANELDKVCLYLGEGERIVAAHIRSVVGSARVDSVFDLNLALGLGELNVALKVIGNLIDWGESPNRIIYMVSQHLFALKKLSRLNRKEMSPGELASKIRVPRRYIKNYLKQVNRLSQAEIDEGLNAVYQAEVALKSRPINQRLLLELMAASVCRPQLREGMPIFGSLGR